MIKAVTFDLWDTLVHDDSDEAKRAARGLRSKRDERRHLVWDALNRREPIDADDVRLAYDVADAAFNHVWHEQSVTWTVRERIDVILAGLGRTLPDEELDRVCRAHEDMEVDIPPDVIDGAADALADLATDFRLAVVSDAIVSPGRCLRRLLEGHGLLGHFSAFAFSDEVGHSKPHRDMFATAAEQLGVRFDEMVHVGDRHHNDVEGPHALGMKAVLFTASRDRDKDITTADAICERHADLPRIVRGLRGG
jgi:putative hydrolase of the HAD superfamily